MYDEEDDPYRILGIERSAGLRELKRAYRRLSFAWHPDRHAHAPEDRRLEAERQFKRIHAAYLFVGEHLRTEPARRHSAPPVRPEHVAPFADAIRTAVASAALRLLARQSRYTYRRVVEVAEQVLIYAVERGDAAFAYGLEPVLLAAMTAAGMDPPLRPSLVRVLLLATSELPWRGKGPDPEIWLARLAPLEHALRETRIE